jgi:hypothetical protein
MNLTSAKGDALLDAYRKEHEANGKVRRTVVKTNA